jgi:protein-disulfide isomerase
MSYDPSPQPPQRPAGCGGVSWAIIGAVVVLVGCLVVVALALAGGASFYLVGRTVSTASVVQRPATEESSALTPLAGAPTALPGANGKGFGPTDAKVVVQEFGDFQCPPCKSFHETIQPRLLSDYLATGKFRFEFHHYIVIDLNTGGAESRHAAEAAECANAQGLFWNYVEVVFAHQKGEGQGAFSDAHLTGFAEQSGLNTEQFNTCFSARQYANAVRQDETLARTLSLNSTPSVLVNGVKVEKWNDYASIAAAIDAEMAR